MKIHTYICIWREKKFDASKSADSSYRISFFDSSSLAHNAQLLNEMEDFHWAFAIRFGTISFLYSSLCPTVWSWFALLLYSSSQVQKLCLHCFIKIFIIKITIFDFKSCTILTSWMKPKCKFNHELVQ